VLEFIRDRNHQGAEVNLQQIPAALNNLQDSTVMKILGIEDGKGLSAVPASSAAASGIV